MGKAILLASRHFNPSHEAAAKKQFGDDVIVIAEDLKWGNNPVEVLRGKLAELAAVGHEVVAVMPTGRDEDLLRIVLAEEELGVNCFRAIFARDERGRNIPMEGGDGRDLVVDHFARMEIRVESVVRTFEDSPGVPAPSSSYEKGWRAGYEAGYSDGVGGHTPEFDCVVDGAGLFRGRRSS